MRSPVRQTVIVASLVSVILSGGAATSHARTYPFNLEVREFTGANPVARLVYIGCEACTIEQYESIVLPPGDWEHAGTRLRTVDTAFGVASTAPLGKSQTLDLVPEVPGDEFVYVAELLDATLIETIPGVGAVAAARVARETVFMWDAGSIVHELTSPTGEKYLLMTIEYYYAQTIDLSTTTALSGLTIASGWTYEGRVLAHDLQVGTNGVANVVAHGLFTSHQRVYPVTAITGKKLALRENADPTRNRVHLQAKDAAIALGGLGSDTDPHCLAGNGGNLLLHSPATGSRFYQALPCGRWKASGGFTPKKYTYTDKDGEEGPCTKVIVKNGSFKAKCKGTMTPSGEDYDLIDGTAQGDVRARLAVGEGVYCMSFGGDVKRDGSDGKSLIAKNAPVAVECM
jgi:hypothetical protein